MLPPETLDTIPGRRGAMVTNMVTRARQLMPYYTGQYGCKGSFEPNTYLIQINAFGIV
jgi:hypothetical protein